MQKLHVIPLTRLDLLKYFPPLKEYTDGQEYWNGHRSPEWQTSGFKYWVPIWWTLLTKNKTRQNKNQITMWPVLYEQDQLAISSLLLFHNLLTIAVCQHAWIDDQEWLFPRTLNQVTNDKKWAQALLGVVPLEWAWPWGQETVGRLWETPGESGRTGKSIHFREQKNYLSYCGV